MESFEAIISGESFKVIRNSGSSQTFSVFNYTTCHIIKKIEFGLWVEVEHRFGTDRFPLDEIGDAIDRHYNNLVC
ncbi:hypothetical protein HDF24_10915 [Mucilaginibacter sp. X4EP1]|uniref:hypothetical protein n=1 Tax=Mucilaginibacter sp. X4EP1 TaxID=2723092 RepID=UPI00216960C5|nr:hypothetical protein [Mucilaginibacter sp. X4EP1]MCS3815589.1 hypothetical protein [Mucilaginibacter sp. X4EP1]